MQDGAAARLVQSVAGQEKALELFLDTLDRMPVGAALLVPVDGGRDFEYVYLNPVNRSLKPGAADVGKTYGEVWPELVDFALPHFREVYETGTTWGAEDAPLQVETEPGKIEVRYYTFQLSRLEADGTHVLLDRSQETTSQVKAIQALRESEEQFHGLVTATTDVLYRMNPDWTEMRQLTSEGFLARTVEPDANWLQKYIHPDDQEHVLSVINHAISTKSVFNLEHRVLREDGTVGWTYSRAVPILSDSGEILEWFGAADDITERKAAQLELDRERRHAILQAERMASLKELAEISAFSSKVDETVERLLDALMRSLGTRAAYVWAIVEGGETLAPAGAAGEVPDSADSYGSMSTAAETISARALRERTPSYIEDMDAEGSAGKHAIAFARDVGFRSGIALPLVIHDLGVGVLALGWAQPRSFDPDQLAFLESVASEVAVGLHNAQLFEAARDSHQKMEQELEATSTLLEAAEELAAAVEVRAALESVARLAKNLTGAQRAFVNLIDEKARTLIPVVPANGVTTPSGNAISFDALSSTARSAIKEKRTRLLDYELPETPDYDRSIAEKNDCKVALFVPLLLHGEIIAHITLDDPGKRHQFCERDIRIVEGIASQASLTVRNAQLLEDRTRQADLAEALNRVNDAVHSSLDFDEIMNRVVVDATGAANLDAAAIHLLEDDVWKFAYAYGLPEDLRALRLTREEAPLSAAVLESGSPLVIADARADERANRQLMSRFDIGALMALPLYVRGEPIGVLFAGCFGSETTLDERQVDFMNKVASTLSLALENARLYENEHRIADRLQQALLTLPDEIPGIEFAHAYKAATEAERVGGDFYDLFELNHDHVGVIVGDVAGKGLDAAMLTSLAKNTIRAHANERGKTPAEILRLTNELIYKATGCEVFVTVFFGILDCRDGRLTYSSAGHTTAAVVRSGRVSSLRATGPLLGAFTEVDFGQAETQLDLGEVLFLYTDGLTEARRVTGEQYGEARAFSLLASSGAESAVDLVSQVVADVTAFTGRGLQDDLAIMALRRTEPGERAPLQQKLEIPQP